MKRIQLIDSLRGITIISMVLFHLFYNINYYHPLDFYDKTIFNKIWQLSIAVSFFTISGITSNFLSKKDNIKRGIKTSIIGFLISIITYNFAKDQLIIWGVLNGLGFSMVAGEFLEKLLACKIWPLFFLAFTFSYDIPKGSLYNIDFFRGLYDRNLFFLGFPNNTFTSTDYFPIIPWIFVFLAGVSLGKYLIKRNFFGIEVENNILAKIGRKSMLIYLLHQLILYPLVSCIFKLIGWFWKLNKNRPKFTNIS